MVLAATFDTVTGFAQASALDGLLAKILSGPMDDSDLAKVERQPQNPRILPALKVAFDHRNDKREKRKRLTNPS
jgi:hypothetical protein